MNVMTHAWNPEDYHRHSSAQASWAHELIGKIKLAGDER
ncbi:MAG: SAM-dependent methyltransferase, partial [Methanomicrobiales archaeon HGW-Methanomicrobiales-2]